MKNFYKDLTDEQAKELDRIRRLPWSAQFHKTLENPTVPGGKVDMYLLIDDDTGESLVGVSVPCGERWLVEYIAGCCADPFFVRHRPYGDSDMAAAFNQAALKFVGENGTIDASEVHLAAMVMIEAYTARMGKDVRQELIDNTIKRLRQVRDGD